VFDAIFVPQGAEADAVREGLAAAASDVAVVTTGIGPRAAGMAAEAALSAGPLRRVLITGLCGLLTPTFGVGDALAYSEVRHPDTRSIMLELLLQELIADRIPDVQSGVHALHSDTIVCSAREKRDLAERFEADAVDMESFELTARLQRAGVAVAIVRVGSDAATYDLPDLERARNGSGGIDGFAMGLAMLRRPLAGARLALNGVRALGVLRRTIAAVVAGA
jgi:nucleoside phosphorylase